MSNFGKSLASLRKEKDLTQTHVAKSLGVTLDTYRQMEYRDGNPRLDTIIKLLEILSASIEELFPELSSKASNLNQNEKQLLSNFHQLKPEQQEAVLKLIESFT